VRPAWGDENMRDARAVGIADSEAARVEKFRRLSDTFVIFPGGASTLQEVSALIAANKYPDKNGGKRRIILVGRKFFGPTLLQYQKMFKSGILEARPEELFTVTDDPAAALSDLGI